MVLPNNRKEPRFPLRCRVRLAFSEGTEAQLVGVTQNVSLGGVLLESPSYIPENCLVSFNIVPERGQMLGPLEFAGTGRVTRVQPDPPGTGYLIALKCAHPISCRRR